jgi:beta-ketoacyl ACP synthase
MVRREPIAVVGMGCLFPGAADRDALSDRLASGRGRFAPFPVDRLWATSPAVRARLESWHGAFFDDLAIEPQRFRIPPAYRQSISSLSLMLLHVAEACVRDAGYADGKLPLDDTDVVCGTCFGFDSTLANALKIEGVRLAHDLAGARRGGFEEMRDRLRDRFGVSSHDRVGEMASAIPARIASYFGLHGRVQTLENADATGFSVIEAAVTALAGGQARAVIAVTGQRIESALTPLALERKGFSGAAGADVPLGEGATALLLKRLGDARQDGDRIHGVIWGLSATRRDSRDGFKYSGDEDRRRRAVEEACDEAGISASDQDYLDCVLPGIEAEAEAVRRTLAELCGSPGRMPRLGSSAGILGHGFANAGLAAVAATCLAFQGKEAPRIAGVTGSSLTGQYWHLVMAEPEVRLAGRIVRTPAPRAGSSSSEGEHAPIAIVGMGGSFGPSEDREAFWRDLRDGRDGVQPLGEAILPRGAYFSPDPQALSTYAQFGAALGDREFDLSRYRIFPKRAEALDVAQKLALRVAAEALADYGLEEKREKSGKAAVIVASSLCLGRERALVSSLHRGEILATLLGGTASPEAAGEEAGIDHLTLDGCLASGAAALVSNCFGLQAATMAVEAACASSLAALQHGVLALRQGRYDFVLAGGVELPANLRDMVLCSSQMMLSRGKIAPFSEGADGFSPGDGAGMFVLKRLDDALRDGDTVHACITGIGGSSDANSMTAPDPDGQERAMRRAFAQAGYPPSSVQYVEAHGTGTRIGDMVEITSLGRVYAGEGRDEPLMIGSVKSNIGHAFAAAGSAGLLKTLLAIRHATMPKTLLRRNLNPELPLGSIPAEIVSETRAWEDRDGVRRAAVNSMGTGGINYHLLLEARSPGPGNRP